MFNIVQSHLLCHCRITLKIYGNYDLIIKLRVIIEAQKQSSNFNFDPKRSNRFKAIKSLIDRGKSSFKIGDYLKTKNYFNKW